MESIAMFLSLIAYSSPTPQMDTLIVGGTEIPIHEAPYQVSIRLEREHFCGGAILNPSHILTAAHCTRFNVLAFTIVAGASSTYDDWEGDLEGEERNVVEKRLHPKFNSSSRGDYDIAIMKVDQPFEFDEHIQPIELADADPPVGAEVFVTGWGALENGDIVVTMLRRVDVDVFSDEECEKSYPESFSPMLLCAGRTGMDSCRGDLGGPLVDSAGKLVGIFTYGKGCGGKGYPGVYTRVTTVRDWILENSDF